MSEVKHTPGPWVHAKGGRVLDESGRLIATAWHPERMPDAQEQRQPGESWLGASIRLRPEVDRIEAKMEEHARLMAAAPKLLKACQQALHALKGREHDQFLRDVIAEATGEPA